MCHAKKYPYSTNSLLPPHLKNLRTPVQREIFGRVKFSDNSEPASMSENLTFENLALNQLMSIYFWACATWRGVSKLVRISAYIRLMALLRCFSSSPRGINLPNPTVPLSSTIPSSAIEEANAAVRATAATGYLANNDKIRESFLGKCPTIVSLFTTAIA